MGPRDAPANHLSPLWLPHWDRRRPQGRPPPGQFLCLCGKNWPAHPRSGAISWPGPVTPWPHPSVSEPRWCAVCDRGQRTHCSKAQPRATHSCIRVIKMKETYTFGFSAFCNQVPPVVTLRTAVIVTQLGAHICWLFYTFNFNGLWPWCLARGLLYTWHPFVAEQPLSGTRPALWVLESTFSPKAIRERVVPNSPQGWAFF